MCEVRPAQVFGYPVMYHWYVRFFELGVSIVTTSAGLFRVKIETMDLLEDEQVLYELPEPPRYLPRPQPDWAAMSASSTRFAVAAMRKSTKAALFRCKRMLTTSKEADRLEAELDRVSRLAKNDMALAKVPKPLLKDRRVGVLEDVSRSLEQMNKKLKVSLFMESYLNDVKDEKKKAVQELETKLQKAKEDAAAVEGTAFPSLFQRATRANRACPPSFSRPRSSNLAESRQASASSAFLFNCRQLSE